ncbi:MAG: hypothetical protein ACEY3J_02810 [Arsenophonus sp.]
MIKELDIIINSKPTDYQIIRILLLVGFLHITQKAVDKAEFLGIRNARFMIFLLLVY